VRGQGARLNGAPIRVSPEADMRRALWAYGLHNTLDVAHVMLKGVRALVDASRGARSFGSAATHLAYVAAGRFTGFTELDLSSWDLAAGSLLVEEAGGRVTDTRGGPFSLLVRDVLASNGASAVHDGALAALAAAGADRVDRTA
jgi:myo-inositol-1(or 4)-monophosphatase